MYVHVLHNLRVFPVLSNVGSWSKVGISGETAAMKSFRRGLYFTWAVGESYKYTCDTMLQQEGKAHTHL